jgi:hypothetical protein
MKTAVVAGSDSDAGNGHRNDQNDDQGPNAHDTSFGLLIAHH